MGRGKKSCPTPPEKWSSETKYKVGMTVHSDESADLELPKNKKGATAMLDLLPLIAYILLVVYALNQLL